MSKRAWKTTFGRKGWSKSLKYGVQKKKNKKKQFVEKGAKENFRKSWKTSTETITEQQILEKKLKNYTCKKKV